MPMLMKMTTWNRRRRMIDRILYTIVAVFFAAAVWVVIKRLKEQQAPADNVYPLQRRTL